jgi:tRNA(Ile)-lysidine synthase
MNIEDIVFQFIEQHIDRTRPVLVGLSGGPDSMCLLHLLLSARQKKPFPLHIAHVDHAWRQESRRECEIIQALAASLDLPCHTIRLKPEEYRGNREAAARLDRIRFFTSLVREYHASGVFLAHHRDDQEETVFKRFLEGASLFYLAGIRSICQIDALTIFRPLLSVPKSELVSWITARGITYFEDPTNFNPDYLRGRLRTQIFPYLRSSFGKEFTSSISRIAADAEEVRLYFDEKVEPYLKNMTRGMFGTLLDLSHAFPESRVEARALLRRFGEMCDFGLNRYQIELACQLVERHAANRTIILEDKELYFDRKRIFCFDKVLYPPFVPMTLEEGTFCFGPWNVTVSREEKVPPKNHWLDLLCGNLATSLPRGHYQLLPFSGGLRLAPSGRSLGRIVNDKKIPRRMADFAPLIVSAEGVVEDFLQGNTLQTKGDQVHIKLEKIC